MPRRATTTKKKSTPYADDQKAQRRSGFYFVDGEPYVSVTTCLEVIDKKALRMWFGKKVYEYMVANPGAKQQDALAAPYKETQDAATRGTNVHSLVDYYLRFNKDLEEFRKHLESVDEAIRGYGHAFVAWLEDYRHNIILNEKTVTCEEYRYAGTLDMVTETIRNGKERRMIVDIKTGKGIYPEYFLQQSAYKYALDSAGYPIDGIAILLLGKDGRYTYAEGDYEIEPFLAARKLWDWKFKKDEPALYESLVGKSKKEEVISGEF